MFKVKYTYENIEFYNCSGIATRLEEMAAKGWMIEKITGKFYKYKKIQPQRLKFAVTYAPGITAYDLSPTLAQRHYLDICEEYGWQPAYLHNQLQVLYNEDINAIEIETDGTNMLDNLHKTAKKTFIPRTAANILIDVLLAINMVLTFIANPLDFICTSYTFPALFAGVFFSIKETIALYKYLKWHKNARIYRATTNELLPAGKNGILKNTTDAICSIVWVWLVLSVFSGVYHKIAASFIIVILLATAVSEFLIKDAKEMGKAASDVRFTGIFAGILVFFVGYYGVLTMDHAVMPTLNEEQTAYIEQMYGDVDVSSIRHLVWYPASYEDVQGRYSHIFPLEIADYNPFVKDRGEFFHRVFDCSLVSYTDARQQAGSFRLQYSIYYPEKPFYQLVLYAVKRTEIPNVFYRNKYPQTDFRFEKADENLWKADKAYQLFDYRGYRTGTYVLCYSDRIVKLQLESPNVLTAEAVVKIADKL